MTVTAPASRSSSGTRSAIVVILLLSAAATAFLFWLIYIHPASDASGTRFAFLPGLNAVFNGLAATALLLGYTFIRSHRITAHRASMITAFGFSTLFLITYTLHHALHGDIRYPLHAAHRIFYLSLLASHIILATVALPLILVTFFFSLSKRIPQHRKVARWTFPIWLYVSITGVVTYVMLRLAKG